MGMVVRTNTMAINAYRQLGMNNSAVAKSLEKLASGYRINRAGDDAAGLAISEKMKAQITGLETASANAQDGISLIQTAEGNLGEVHDMLNRMVELATKSANGTYTQTERDALQAEVDQLLSEIDRISKSANFNGAKLLDGSLAANNAIMESGITTLTAVDDGVLDGTSSDLAVNVVTSTHANSGSVVAKQNPEFAINLADFEYKVALNTNADQNIVVTLGDIGGTAVEIYTTSAGANALQTALTSVGVTHAQNAAAKTYTAGDIAGLFDGKAAVIGKDVYSITKDGDKLKFTYAGQKKGNDLVAENAEGGAPTADSKAPTGDVIIDISGGSGVVSPTRVDCNILEIKDPQAGGDVKRAGASLQLTQAILDRGSLTIGDTTFTFDSSKEAKDAATPLGGGTKTGTVTIGTKGLTGAALLQSVTEQMSHCTVKVTKDGKEYDFTVGRGNATDTIEIEEKKQANAADLGAFTADELKKAFTQTVKAANAQAQITLSKDADENFVNVSAGNTLKIGDTTYKFTEDGKGTNEVKIGDTAVATLNNLKTKLGTNYNVTVDAANGKITIENKNKTPKEFGDVEYTAKTVDNGGLTLQIGDTADDFNKMTVAVENMSAKGLGLDGLQITKEKLASDAIDTIKKAINDVSTARAGMGALQNRLEHTINNLDVAAENLSAANSRIRDTDMAKEMMNYTKMNVLVQSAQAMLAQANQQPQSVLQLLQ